MSRLCAKLYAQRLCQATLRLRAILLHAVAEALLLSELTCANVFHQRFQVADALDEHSAPCLLCMLGSDWAHCADH